jgi:DNA primase large subunit
LTEKTDKFKEELELIKNENIRKFAEQAIEILPDYFFVISSSSTNRYHPAYALGDGGLTRHSKAAVRIAYEMFRLEWWNFEDDQKDLIITALILHDGWKSGLVQQRYTVFEHPIIAAKMIEEKFSKNDFIDNSQVLFICDLIKVHMGAWTRNKQGEEVLEKPVTKFQKFTHLADYLASRKFLEVNFDIGLSKE